MYKLICLIVFLYQTQSLLFGNLFSITNEPFLFSSQNHIDENNFNPYHLKFKNNFKNDFYIKTSVNSVLSNKLPNNILNLGFLNRFDDLSAYILAQVGYGDISMFELGSYYTRNGIVGRINRALIAYEKSKFSFFFGRSNPIWGVKKVQSIILSNNNLGLDHFLASIKVKNIDIQILHGQLSSNYEPDGNRIRRNISGHKFGWKPNISSYISLGELVIYAGENRGMELIYLNPFIPYFFSGLEGEQSGHFKDNTNSILFLYGEMRIKGLNNLFFELLIDDYQLDDTREPNSFGLKLGFIKNFKIFNIPSELIFENNYIKNNAYLHRSKFTEWNNFGHSLGYPFGPDNSGSNFIFKTRSESNFSFFLEFNFLKKGNSFFFDSQKIFDERENVSEQKKYIFGNIFVSKKFKDFLIRIGWYNKPFPLELANGQNSLSINNNGTFYFNIKYSKWNK